MAIAGLRAARRTDLDSNSDTLTPHEPLFLGMR